MTIHHTRLYGFAARLPGQVISVRVPSRPEESNRRRRNRGHTQERTSQPALNASSQVAADHSFLPVSATVPFVIAGRPVGSRSEMAMRLLAVTMEDATGLPFTPVEPSTWMKAHGGEHTGSSLIVDQVAKRPTTDSVSIRVPVLVTDGEDVQFGVAVQLTFTAGFIARHAEDLGWKQNTSRRPLVLRVSPEWVNEAEPFYRFTFDLDGRDHQVKLRSGAHKANTGTRSSSRVSDRTDVGPGAGRLQIFEGGPALQPLCDWKHLRVWQRDAQAQEHLVALGTQESEVVWTRELQP
jgi:hypothetical protein